MPPSADNMYRATAPGQSIALYANGRQMAGILLKKSQGRISTAAKTQPVRMEQNTCHRSFRTTFESYGSDFSASAVPVP